MKRTERPGVATAVFVVAALALLAMRWLAGLWFRHLAGADALQREVAIALGIGATLLPLLQGVWAAVVLRSTLRLKRDTPGRLRLVVASGGALGSAVGFVAAAAVLAWLAAAAGTGALHPLELVLDPLEQVLGAAWAPRLCVLFGVVLVVLGDLAFTFGGVAAWFLVPRGIRARFWSVFDALLLCAVAYALARLPGRPPEDEPDALWLPLTRHMLTTLGVIRLTLRSVPPLLDLVERVGFRALVAARHLRAKKSGFLAAIGLLSIFAVTVSSCSLATTLSVMGGFRNDLKRKILGHHAHVVVDRQRGTFAQWGPILERVRSVEQVVGASPLVSGEVMLSSASNLGTAVLRGIDPESIAEVSELTNNLSAGRIEYLTHPERLLELPPDEYRGSSLQRKLRVLTQKKSKRTEAREATEAPGASPATEQERPDQTTKESSGQPPSDSRSRNAASGQAGAAPSDSASRTAASGQESPVPNDSRSKTAASGTATRPRKAPPKVVGAALAAPEPSVASGPARDVMPGIIMGQELARSLRLFLGDEVNVVAPLGSLGPSGPMPKSRPFRVAAIFYTGMYEYDMKYAYVTLGTAQRFLGTGDAISAIEIKVGEVEHAPRAAQHVRASIGMPSLRVRDWQELNKRLFGALALEKLAMFVALGIAILVAGFCIAGTLTLMVQEKGREVAVLKALGTASRAIVAVFVIEGGLIGLFGSALGLFLGYMVCFAAENLGIRMNPEVYYIDRLPIHTDPLEFALVGVASVAVCLLVTIYPALLASRLRPVDALRHE